MAKSSKRITDDIIRFTSHLAELSYPGAGPKRLDVSCNAAVACH
jgi:hypothetical protein